MKFNAGGGKGKMSAQSFTYGKAKKLAENKFTRSGWVFVGWAVKKGGAVKYKNAQSVKNLAAAGKTATLYAVWAKKIYKVAFYANGGKGKMTAQKMTYGKAKKLTANKFKAPKGKNFAGWAKSAALAKKGTVAYKNKQAVKNLLKNGKTVKLYAVWMTKKKTKSLNSISSKGAVTITTGGDAKWRIATVNGKTVARSETIGIGKKTWLVATFSGAGTFKCKYGGNCYKLHLILDGEERGSFYGYGLDYPSEQEFSVKTSGIHMFKFEYAKADSVDKNDFAYVWDVQWVPKR